MIDEDGLSMFSSIVSSLFSEKIGENKKGLINGIGTLYGTHNLRSSKLRKIDSSPIFLELGEGTRGECGMGSVMCYSQYYTSSLDYPWNSASLTS
jgi:hypothetical protein